MIHPRFVAGVRETFQLNRAEVRESEKTVGRVRSLTVLSSFQPFSASVSKV